jgi:Ca2+-binding EF-hand superfamily protein
VQNLKEIFDLFDKEKNQTINVKDLETIMGSLQRDPAEVREFIDDLGQEISFD